MAGDRVEAPRISKPVLDWFTRYTRVYLRRNFHSVRLLKGTLPQGIEGRPLIVVMNHPGWWDPLIGILLARDVFPRRVHYAPIEGKALEKYKFFEKLGLFGIDPGTVKGAARFLRIGSAALANPEGAMWVTAHGAFADARKRPVELRPGVGHLVSRLERVAVVPLAIEYVFWEERYPEALMAFGAPLLIDNGRERTAGEWTSAFAQALEATQDRLAVESIARQFDRFDVLIGGRTGIGGVYDAWRSFKSKLRGETFTSAHGAEKLR